MENSNDYIGLSNIDRERLRADLRAFGEQSRALKRVLRTRWERPMDAEQRRLAELRKTITALCCLRATLRGRVHLPDPELQSRLAARTARHYELPEESCSSSTSA